MIIPENALEQMVYENCRAVLHDRGLYIPKGKKISQVKIGNYGICDMLIYKRPHYFAEEMGFSEHEVTIVELKKDEININTVLQVLRYAKGIERYFERKGLAVSIKFLLIGKRIEEQSSFCYLKDYSPFEIYLYDYAIDGLNFRPSADYYLSNEGF